MTINELLSLAKDYRGDRREATGRHGDCIIPHRFDKQYSPHYILTARLRNASFTSFCLDGNTISNVTSDGCAIIAESHSLPYTTEAWSNRKLGYTSHIEYRLLGLTIIDGMDGSKISNDIGEGAWWFGINKKLVSIHHKVLSDGSFELEILDPYWIIGFPPQ